MGQCKQIIEFSIQDEKWTQDHYDWENFFQETTLRVFKFLNILSYSFEVSYVLAGDEMIHQLNREYRGKDKPTNVLSFHHYEKDQIKDFLKTVPTYPILLGDVVLSYGIIFEEAKQGDKLFLHHVRHLVVHGLLHLLGYDHENENDAHVMEALEIDILKSFDISNPYH